MHIPGHMLVEPVEMVTSVVAAVGMGGAVVAALKAEEKPSRADFVKVTALIFVMQMLNFPVQEGTSGHFLGGVLAAALLGPSFGIMAMGLVITIQTLVFGDGGITALGANLVNMALIGVGVGVVTRYLRGAAALAATAWLSVVAASFACGVMLVLSHPTQALTPLFAMVSVHAVTGVAEAALT
ncbi:MAG: energy-coupling factor ABC transporter permease, partial [Syntrophales bacterium]|nr:energy-coupling factor ABC transporter permease [Syntrophales bacterium]